MSYAASGSVVPPNATTRYDFNKKNAHELQKKSGKMAALPEIQGKIRKTRRVQRRLVVLLKHKNLLR